MESKLTQVSQFAMVVIAIVLAEAALWMVGNLVLNRFYPDIDTYANCNDNEVKTIAMIHKYCDDRMHKDMTTCEVYWRQYRNLGEYQAEKPMTNTARKLVYTDLDEKHIKHPPIDESGRIVKKIRYERAQNTEPDTLSEVKRYW
jgi:hypothetical protein